MKSHNTSHNIIITMTIDLSNTLYTTNRKRKGIKLRQCLIHHQGIIASRRNTYSRHADM